MYRSCRSALMAVILLAVVAPSAAAQELSPAEREAVSNAVIARAEEYLSATRDRNPDRMMAHLSDEIVFVVNAVEYRSAAELRPLLSFVERLQHYEGEWVRHQVIPLARDAAIFHAVGRVEQITAAGERRSFPSVYWTALYRLVDGEWKMTLVHQSYSGQ
jgi:ketosteroid isomerase-like protein